MLFAEGLLSSAQASFRLLAERLDTFTDKAFSRSLRISSTLSFVSLQTQEHIVFISVVDSGSSEVVDGTVIFYRRRQKHFIKPIYCQWRLFQSITYYRIALKMLCPMFLALQHQLFSIQINYLRKVCTSTIYTISIISLFSNIEIFEVEKKFLNPNAKKNLMRNSEMKPVGFVPRCLNIFSPHICHRM